MINKIPQKSIRFGVKVTKRSSSRTTDRKKQENDIRMIDSEYNKKFVSRMFGIRGM